MLLRTVMMMGGKLGMFQVLSLALVSWVGKVGGADLVIRIPGDLSQQDGFYRLDYRSVLV